MKKPKHRYRPSFKRPPEGIFEAKIFDLSHDGRGIAHVDGKVVFIEGALPSEQVSFEYIKTHESYDEAKVVEIMQASADRVEPICDYFGICGGCSLQHLAHDQQIVFKQAQMLNNLKSLAKVTPLTVLAPLRSASVGYRYKGRLGAKSVAAKGRVLVGFREKHASFLTDMHSCPVLVEQIGLKLDDLSDLIGKLSIATKVPQIELAASSSNGITQKIALSFRIMDTPTAADLELLSNFGEQHNILIYLQPRNEASTYALTQSAIADDALSYTLLDDIKLSFKPYHFTQVNPEINTQMIKQALELLDLNKDETVLDLFCGLGNFTLALAKYSKKVIGVEGDPSLVEWAQKNTQRNNMDNVEFFCTDLTKPQDDSAWIKHKYDAVLVDPSRKGALEMMPYLGKLAPKRILYVSCHPATLARDINVLVNDYDYIVKQAGVMDMFPHTAHVESMVLLTKK